MTRGSLERTTHWGKKRPDSSRPRRRPGGVRPFPSATRLGPRSRGLARRPRDGRARAPHLSSGGDHRPTSTKGARATPSFPRPPGDHRSPERRLPRLVLSSKVLGLRAGGATPSQALCFPVPCPAAPVPRPHCCDCAGRYYSGNSRPFARFSSRGAGPGAARRDASAAAEADGAPPPTPRRPPSARRSGRACAAASAPRPAPGGSAR